MIIGELTIDNLTLIKETLDKDGVIAFPTDTVYGLAAKYGSFLALDKIFHLKKRPCDKKLSIMLAHQDLIKNYGIVDEMTQNLIDAYMPGPLTIVLPLTNSSENIGIRIPKHPIALQLLSYLDYPLWVSSANISNENDLIKVEDVINTFDDIDIIVSGSCYGDRPSSVVLVANNEYKILRPGLISEEMIKGVIK